MEWDNYRAFKRNKYNPETAIKFVRGKYFGLRGVIESVTKKII